MRLLKDVREEREQKRNHQVEQHQQQDGLDREARLQEQFFVMFR